MVASTAILLGLLCAAARAQQPDPPPEVAFAPVPPPAADRLRFDRDLPDLEFHDVQGRLWRTADFRGKFTLVYVWHTFEARLVDAHAGRGDDQLMREMDLPDLREIQRFHERSRRAARLQILTFCSDYDYTHAPEYMKQAGFTFPVVADFTLIDKFLGPAVRGSRYAVISPEAKVSVPFRSWTLGRLLFELESLAAN
ncbi:MAG: hypothetical protein KGN84_14140 [Acidobacteriota bacterium]|nr:hypothetical protein [Acidobacteriota bacterium]